MGAPSLKIPSADVVWRARDQRVFVTREHDGYYVWGFAPDMRKYGYATGYAWSFMNPSKAPAVRRARTEAARLAQSRDRSRSRRDEGDDEWHVLDTRTGCVCPVGSERAARARADQANRAAGEKRLVAQRRGCTTGRAPEDRPVFFEAHDQRRRDPRTRNADLIAWYRKNGDLSMGRGFREEKIEWLRHSNREPALAAMRRLGYRG